MKLFGKLSLGICLMTFSLQSAGQELYELFGSYNTEANKSRNKTLLSTEVWRKPGNEKSRLTRREYFNIRGLHDSIVFFDGKAAGDRLLFYYDEKDRVVLISGTVYLTQIRKEFEYAEDHHMIHTYFRLEDSFMLMQTRHVIFKAGKPALEYTIEGLNKDTGKVICYNENGKEYYAKSNLGDDFIREEFYEWNEDNSRVAIFELREGKRELSEMCYYDTKGNLLKKMQATKTSLVAGFEYDEELKMIASAYFTYKNNYVYDEKGYLKAVHSESVVKENVGENLPELVLFEFKYQFR